MCIDEFWTINVDQIWGYVLIVASVINLTTDAIDGL